jgi:tetratricopeptide (TPR) repeat protein
MGESVKHPPNRGTPLVGREVEVETIRACLRSLPQKQGKVLALRGEAGTGKTRLARAAVEEARLVGAITAFAPCRGSVNHPYQPLAELAYGLLDIDPALSSEAQRARVEKALASLHLSALLPIFIRLLGLPSVAVEDAPTAGASQPRPGEAAQTITRWPGPLQEQTVAGLAEQVNLGEALGEVVRAFSTQGHMVVLAFDDIDQAGDLTRAVFLHLQGGIQSRPVLLIVTTSPDIFPELGLSPDTMFLDLSPLPRDDILALGEAFLGAESLSPSLANLLWERSQGRPLFAQILVNGLHQIGQVTIDEAVGEACLCDSRLTAELPDIIAAHLNSLPQSQQDTLRCGAILGDGFRMGALGTLRGQLRSDELYDELAELVRTGWLEHSGRGRNTLYRFAHPLVRDILYESIPTEERIRLHTRAGDYYAVPATGRRLRTENALYHYFKADNPAKALTVLDLALMEARKTADLPRMMTLYRQGIDIAATDASLAERQKEMCEALGDLHASMGDYKQAAKCYAEIGPVPGALNLMGKWGLVLLAGEPEKAVSILGQAAPLISYEYPEDLRWRLEAGLVWGLTLVERYYEAVRHCRDVLGTLSEMVGFGAARTLMRAMLGMALFYQGDSLEAAPHLESARAGWSARGELEGVAFINQVVAGASKAEITLVWLRWILPPLLSKTLTL